MISDPSESDDPQGTLPFSTADSSGDMLVSVYDPQGIAADAFARANHTGTQAISTVTGLQTALDGKVSKSGDTMTGSLTLSSGSVAVSTGGLTSRDGLKINNADEQYNRSIRYDTNDVARWELGVSRDAETGGNAGSTFSLSAFGDDGTWLGYAMRVDRPTRAVSFPGGVGADSVVYANPASGGVSRGLADILQGSISPLDFGAATDGSTDSTAAFNNALAAARSAGAPFRIPEGVFIVNAIVLKPFDRIAGEHRDKSILKLKAAANSVVLASQNFSSLVASPPGSSDINDGSTAVELTNFTIDGNKDQQTTWGYGLELWGSRLHCSRLNIRNVYKRGLWTEWVPGTDEFGSYTTNGAIMRDILVQNCGEHGIYNNGPNDTFWDNVVVLDAGQAADATYYGMWSKQSARINMYHVWHKSSASNRCAYGLRLDAVAEVNQTHLEGCRGQLYGNATGSLFHNCYFYAPFGGDASSMVYLPANYHTFMGCHMEGGDYFGSPIDVYAVNFANSAAMNTFVGCFFSGFSKYSPFNFSSSGGGNRIIACRGYVQNSGGATHFGGTIGQSDDIDYKQLGGTAFDLRKPRAFPTSSAGLPSGSIWNSGGTLKVV